jgi:hypothetical protein
MDPGPAIRATRDPGTTGQAKDRQNKEDFMIKITRVFTGTIIALVIAAALLTAPAAANAAVFVGVGFAPPAIPVYAQPIAPDYGYIWTPGYWAYGDAGYYWVDGAWVDPPYVGALWTPGYWGWGGGGYFWNAGYWGRSIGYYGGINYGFGYFGVGFWGGYWNGGHFFYNGAYNHLGFHNGFVYNHPVAGFDGRPGGAAIAHGGGAEGFRGSGINGNAGARTAYNGGASRNSFAGGGAAASRGSYSSPAVRSSGSYGGGASSGGGARVGGGGFSGGGGGGGHAGGGGGHR